MFLIFNVIFMIATVGQTRQRVWDASNGTILTKLANFGLSGIDIA